MKCLKCDKEALYFSRVKPSPLCKECAMEEIKKIPNAELDDYYIKFNPNIVEVGKEKSIDLGEEY